MSDNREKNERLVRNWMEKWDGGKAQIWEYSVSLRRLAIRVTSDNHAGNLHIRCSDTIYIRGFVEWDNCHFQLDLEHDERGDIIYIIRDEKVGFLVRCGVIEVAENVKPVY